MQKYWLSILSLAIVLLSSACGSRPIADGDEVATIVAATLGAGDAPSETSAPAADPAAPQRSNYIFCQFCNGIHIWRVSSGEPVLVPGPDFFNNLYDFSPVSGKFLITSGYEPYISGVFDLSLLDIATGQLTIIVADNAISAHFAPDGETFAYLLGTPSTRELHLRTPDGFDRILATDVNFAFAFSQAGNQIAFSRTIEGGEVDTSLHVIDLTSGEERHIADIDRSGGGSITDNFHWSPDGSEYWLPVIGNEIYGNVLVTLADGAVNQIKSKPGVFEPFVDDPIGVDFVLWGPNEDQFIGYICRQCGEYIDPMLFSSESIPGPIHIVLFHLDSSHTTVTSITSLYEFPAGGGGLLYSTPRVYWNVPGESLWAIATRDGNPTVVHIDLP